MNIICQFIKVHYTGILLTVLCVSKYSHAWHTNEETFLNGDLRIRLLLPSTGTIIIHLEKETKKWDGILEDFCVTGAMTNRTWMRVNYGLRHIVIRSVGYCLHHRICKPPQRVLACVWYVTT
jgi:hypothetical protein